MSPWTILISAASPVFTAVSAVDPVAAPAAVGSVTGQVALALGLLALGVLALVLEVMLISFGLLAVAAVALSLAGITVAFALHPVFGWALLLLTPALGLMVLRSSATRLQRMPWVPQAEVTADAGYRHVTDALGIVVGARGTLVTDAYPTGRARFPVPFSVPSTTDGLIDVQVQGGSGSIGAHVSVVRIDGARVLVQLDDPLHQPSTAT